MSIYTNFGPGDDCTWPAYYGNQNDPRAPEPTYEEQARMDAMTDEDDDYDDE